MRRERGFALLVVLWSLVLITLLTTQILSSGRTALNLAANLRAAAQARAADDGAINVAIYHLAASSADAWTADGSAHILSDGAASITVRINSLAGTINPNLASTALLTGLFQALGASASQAQSVANGIIAWRSPAETQDAGKALLGSYRRAGLPYGPPGAPLNDLTALAYVMGMNPALLARALPELSLYQSGDPDPIIADKIVRRALALSGQSGSSSTAYTGNAPVVSISAELDGPGGLAVRRVAIVSIAGGNGAVPYQLLALHDAATQESTAVH